MAIKCPNCGALLSSTANKCSICNTAIVVKPTSPPAVPQTPPVQAAKKTELNRPMASAPKIGHNNKLILILLSVVAIGVLVGVGLYGYDLHRQSVERQRADKQANDDLLSKVKDDNIRTEWDTFMTERGTERTTQDTKLYSWVAEARGETQDRRQLESDVFDKKWGVTDDYLRKLADLGMTVDQAKAQMAKDGITDPSLPADWHP